MGAVCADVLEAEMLRLGVALAEARSASDADAVRVLRAAIWSQPLRGRVRDRDALMRFAVEVVAGSVEWAACRTDLSAVCPEEGDVYRPELYVSVAEAAV